MKTVDGSYAVPYPHAYTIAKVFEDDEKVFDPCACPSRGARLRLPPRVAAVQYRRGAPRGRAAVAAPEGRRRGQADVARPAPHLVTL